MDRQTKILTYRMHRPRGRSLWKIWYITIKFSIFYSFFHSLSSPHREDHLAGKDASILNMVHQDSSSVPLWPSDRFVSLMKAFVWAQRDNNSKLWPWGEIIYWKAALGFYHSTGLEKVLELEKVPFFLQTVFFMMNFCQKMQKKFNCK